MLLLYALQEIPKSKATTLKAMQSWVSYMCKFQHISLPSVDLTPVHATLSNQEMLDKTNDVVECLHEAECEEFTGTDAEQSVLLVLQTKQQSRWLQQCKNTITCVDHTYKTLR